MVFYTALGDSITAGKSASSPMRSYPRLVNSYLQGKSTEAYYLILARPGWTSRSLLDAVLSNSPVPLKKSTTISIWVGGNDLLRTWFVASENRWPTVLKKRLAKYQQNLETLLTFIRQWSQARIILCRQFNPFPNTPLAIEAIEELNAVTSRVGVLYQTPVAPVDVWFSGQEELLIAGYRSGRIEDAVQKFPFGPYPVHPNDKGHQLIARNLVSYIK